MNAFFHAITFLTRIPVPFLKSSREDWEKSAVYYPLVGMVLGLLVWAGALFLMWGFPVPLAAVLLVVWWVLLTGGIHLDGWMDLADGLGSSRDRERMLHIMKDSRVGAMGVLAVVLLLMVKVVAVYQLIVDHRIDALAVSPLIARFALMAAIWYWPYIREGGMASGLKKGLDPVRVLLGLFISLALTFAVLGLSGWITAILALGAGWLFGRYLVRKLGGFTGDGYGALVEWTEVIFLLLVIIGSEWGS
ncbi:MAG: adenosylcobinamide-GDP ribazoletransferase [Bacillaceae bacterium]|nr:adenosylcobinamide-GDP ribazoletransferase [Bacillaceae bacterium]